jgi:hypothetical protein
MPTALGLSTVLGTGVETVYGTTVPITRRHPILSESLQRQNTILQSEGVTGSLVAARRGARRVISARSGSGDVVMELAKNGLGRWFQLMLGGTSTITQQGVTTAWRQTHNFGPLTSKMLTVQKSLRDGLGAEVETFTFHGCKCTGWELGVTVDAIPRLTVSLDAEDVDTTTANTVMVALAEPAGGNFAFLDGALTVGGSPIARVLEASISGDNSLKTDSYFIGGGGTKAEPEVTNFRTVTGSLTAEFTDPVPIHDRFTADTPVAMVLTFDAENIASTFDYQCIITIPEIHFTGSTPVMGGTDLISQSAPFEAAWNGVDPMVKIEYQSTDTVI